MKQSYLVLGEQSNIAVAPSAKVETCRNGAIDPESSRDRWSTWIQIRGQQKPSSPKPREKDDIVTGKFACNNSLLYRKQTFWKACNPETARTNSKGLQPFKSHY